MTERLDPAALAELFLFEKLSDERLAWLAERGQVRSYEAGATVYPRLTTRHPPVPAAGGHPVVGHAGSRGRDRVQPDRPPQHLRQGVLCLPGPAAGPAHHADATPSPTAFWELSAEDFGWAVREWFPMATHMLGFAVQGMGSQQTVSTRERLVALGTVTAGLTPRAEQPGDRRRPATATLSERLAGLWEELAGLAESRRWTPTGWPRWPAWSQASDGRGGQAPLSPLEASDREDELGGWLEEHGVARAWELAPPLVARRGRHRLAGAGRRRPRRGAAPCRWGRGHDLRCREPCWRRWPGRRDASRRSLARPSSTARWTAAPPAGRRRRAGVHPDDAQAQAGDGHRGGA